MTRSTVAAVSEPTVTEVDAIVIGAGFGGIRTLIELDKMGLSATILEAGSWVGGTWYWNRYPGARTDSLSWTYCYLFDKELATSWEWSHNYPLRETVQAYLAHVIEHFSLAPHVQFNSRVASAVFDETTDKWTVTTESGQVYRCTYFITCVGHLSAPTVPDFLNEDVFEGDIYYTSQWPQTEVDLTGKRVLLVGTGASAVQAAPRFAEQAENLTVFQRTPNYVLPARYRELGEEERKHVSADYEGIFERTRAQAWGFDMQIAGRMYDDVTDEEREAIFEENYEKGGFYFVFETFDDVVTDQRSNDAAAAFLRRKIREVVADPVTADLLCPTYPLVSKRPPVGAGYFEMFNRDNVSLVDVSTDPIVTTTARGLQTTAAEYEADVIVIATGFDISTGSLTRMDIRGLGGKSLADEWKKGFTTYLGVATPGFPNMFMVAGPQAGAGNQPVIMERVTEFISELINYARENGKARVEVKKDAADEYTALLQTILDATVVAKSVHETGSYLVGANTPGKVQQPMLYLGGFSNYSAAMDASKDSGYQEFALTSAG